MTSYTNLFTPETWTAFLSRGCGVTGFTERQQSAAERVEPGDILVCYTVRLSRWCGLLRVLSPMYMDRAPIFSVNDPYVVRFKVEPIVALDLELAIPIFEEGIWEKLSLTKNLEPRSFGWAQSANLRSSLRLLSEEDATLLKELLLSQAEQQKIYTFSLQDQRRLGSRRSILAGDREVVVEVPDEVANTADAAPEQMILASPRESHRIQALLASIGIQMGYHVWIPRSDRQVVLDQVPTGQRDRFLTSLPLNYDEPTLKTVEQIDVLWLKGRSMARAFEVEHTTAIYSGLLRMADLLALQPNMDIKLHIVAPTEKREKVLREIRRPVFSLLDRGPLYESCSYLPYEAVEEIERIEHLTHMKQSILDQYAESAEDE